MAASPQQLPPPTSGKKSRGRKRGLLGGRARGEQARTVALVLLAVLMTLFAVLNVKEVKVDWIFGSARAPLIIVIAASLLVGIVLTHFAERRSGKRK
jgi:uncharacterized integral membrane protein